MRDKPINCLIDCSRRFAVVKIICPRAGKPNRRPVFLLREYLRATPVLHATKAMFSIIYFHVFAVTFPATPGMSEVQRKVYKGVLMRDIDAVNGVNGNRTAILNIVMQLRKCCNHPYLFPNTEDRNLDPMGEHLVENCGKVRVCVCVWVGGWVLCVSVSVREQARVVGCWKSV